MPPTDMAASPHRMTNVAAILSVPPLLRSDGTTDTTTSHLTNPAKDAGQVIGYSHSTRLPKDGSQVAGYEPCPKVEGSVAKGQDVITAQLDNLLSARLARRDESGAMVIKRGTVNFGAQDKSLESKRVQGLSRGKDGVWLVG